MRVKHVVHGPFPARMRFFGIAAALAFCGTLMTIVALLTDHVECPSSGMCMHDGRPMVDRARLRGAHAEIRRGTKNSKYGVVVFEVADGPPLEGMHVDPDQANEVAARVRAAIASGAPFSETMRGPYWITPFTIAMVIAGFVLFVLALAKMGRFDLIVDGRKLHVHRSLFWIPLGSREVSIEGVSAVRVEHAMMKNVMKQRYEKDIDACRLHLVYENGNDVPLTHGIFPGYALHLRAASALRAMLGLQRDERDDAELARIPMRKWDMGTRIAGAYVGVTTGSLVGMALFWSWIRLMGMPDPEGWVLAAGGAGLGAIGGAALAFHATRTRLPR